VCVRVCVCMCADEGGFGCIGREAVIVFVVDVVVCLFV